MGGKKYAGRRAAAFIFDLDGTLIDSAADIARAANFARARVGLPELPQDLMVSFVGDGVRRLLARALGHPGAEVEGPALEEAIAAFHDHYGRHCLDATAPYPEVRETLLRFHRLPLMVATNKPRRHTRTILEGLHLAAAFRRIVAPEDAGARKPDPRVLRACLEGLDVPREEVVVVGDHPNDVEAARAIGAIAVGATYGLGSPAAVRASGPDLLIGSFGELVRLFPSRRTG